MLLVLSSEEVNPLSPVPVSDELAVCSSWVSDTDGDIVVSSSAIALAAEVVFGAAFRAALGRAPAFRLAAAFFLVLFAFVFVAAAAFFFATPFFPFFPLFLALAFAIRLALISTYS